MSSSGGNQATLDRFGMIMAGICVFHCAILPLTILVLPILGVLHENSEWLHAPLALLAVAICLIAILTGRYRHNSWGPTIFGSIGILLLLLSLAEDQFGELVEYMATIGALFAASAHWFNIRATAKDFHARATTLD